MSGHSKWAQIKHQKGVTDLRRGKLFSKLSKAITAAAKTDPNPQFNPRLRTAIETAKANQMPNDNIERAVTRAQEAGEGPEELLFEAYSPGGAAVIIKAITDNRNRTVAEIKKLLANHASKWAESGSVRWAFESDVTGEWRAKFFHELAGEDGKKLERLLVDLKEHEDVQSVYTNSK